VTSTAATGLLGEIEFDPQTATVDAIQRAAYRLSDRLSVEIELRDSIRCTIFATTEEPSSELLAAFRNEVLDQVLRERIRNETEGARNVILALAFSQTGAVDVS
jgi:His-Xaa-Ser system protein HxsD